jgi:tRNA-dihydrouridine synthase
MFSISPNNFVCNLLLSSFYFSSLSLSACLLSLPPSSGLYDCGVRVICIHGRTRGSTRHRRVGPADLATIGQIAAHLHSYHQTYLETLSEADSDSVLHSTWSRRVVVLANGNIVSPEDIPRNQRILFDSFSSVHHLVSESCPTLSSPSSLSATLPPAIGGIMSGEGILKDPAIFQRSLLLLSLDESSCRLPSLRELFVEYCHLSQIYSSLHGWQGFNILEQRKQSSPGLVLLSSSSSPQSLASIEEQEQQSPPPAKKALIESKELSVARQHLNWLLGKSGHGRLIRYEHRAREVYRTQVDQMNAMNCSRDIHELLQIAESSLPPS